jgi:hypothetical protein
LLHIIFANIDADLTHLITLQFINPGQPIAGQRCRLCMWLLPETAPQCKGFLKGALA